LATQNLVAIAIKGLYQKLLKNTVVNDDCEEDVYHGTNAVVPRIAGTRVVSNYTHVESDPAHTLFRSEERK